MITYHFDKRANQWGIVGPESEVRIGPVTVRTKNGAEKPETVIAIGGKFAKNGQTFVYGKLQPRDAKPDQTTPQSAPATKPPGTTLDRVRECLTWAAELQAALNSLLEELNPQPQQTALPEPRRHQQHPPINHDTEGSPF